MISFPSSTQPMLFAELIDSILMKKIDKQCSQFSEQKPAIIHRLFV
jgi:hypothetical protein